MDEKDRLGTLLKERERAEEDRYFAERDRESIAQLKRQHETEHEQTIRELARSRCPHCGERLRQRAFHGVMVDECPACQGIWFDKEELRTISQRKGEEWTGRFIERLIHLLTHPLG